MKEYKVMNDYLYYRDLFSDTMGINYRVAPVQNRKPVGHKVLCEVNPSISGNADMWKRVKLLLEGIKKSNIPFLYSPEKINVGDKGNQLIFEYFKGKNFEQILVDAEKKGMPINFDLAMSISIAIADIIEVGSSIIVSGERSYHGFLTPDNILIHYDGKIFLKNYGIFQYLDKNDQFYSETEKRYGAWLTPEFIRKERIVAQSDIYHLGYLIYRVLTGKYFSYSAGEDFDAKFANLSFKQYMPSTDKNFLTNVITFFKKTLNPDPLKRFLTIKEFKDFIANYFHIEELSSITFNLAYFMNSLYGEAVEEEEKVLKHELAYVVPEPKKETQLTQQGKDDLVSGILEGLDERKKMPGWLWPVLGGVVLAAAVGIFIFVTSGEESQRAHRPAAGRGGSAPQGPGGAGGPDPGHGRQDQGTGEAEGHRRRGPEKSPGAREAAPGRAEAEEGGRAGAHEGRGREAQAGRGRAAEAAGGFQEGPGRAGAPESRRGKAQAGGDRQEEGRGRQGQERRPDPPHRGHRQAGEAVREPAGHQRHAEEQVQGQDHDRPRPAAGRRERRGHEDQDYSPATCPAISRPSWRTLSPSGNIRRP